jgi:hypothetical protein
MAERRYGPTRGAGVVLIEKEGDKTIEPAALGWAGYAGILEKGPVGELIECSSKSSFIKKCGGYNSDTLLPDAAFHFYNIANGAGGIYAVRVTDGSEVKAELTLYARYGDKLTPMGKIKAHNGGRWGGKELRYADEVPNGMATDLDETTIDTGLTLLTDELKGGYLELEDVANKQYPIISNTTAGVVTVASDQKMETDYGSGTSDWFYITVERDVTKEVTFRISDGEENPTTEFSLYVYVNGDFVKKYPNLSTDPTSSRYWVNVINNDGSNYEIEVVDSWTGAHTAAVRPANIYGKISTITTTVLTAEIADFEITVSPSGADATFAIGTTTDVHLPQKITCTMSAAATFDAVSDKFGSLGSGSTDTEFAPENKWAPPFTVTEGSTALATSDVFVINYKPFVKDQLIGGFLYPDKPNAPLTKFNIVDNDHKNITASDASDLTVDGAIDDYFLVEYPQPLVGGKDGIGDIADSDYTQQAWDTSASPFNRIFGRNMGLIKVATPGITSTAVQKAGIAYAAAKNYQYRYEIPSATVTENGALSYINDTLGRNDFAVTSFPSYSYVADPSGGADGKIKLVSSTGMAHGEEARIAADNDGYHKAQSGQDAILPAILKLPTGEAVLNEEILNPAGINVIKKVKGNYVLWGDRTLYLDPTWKWKHQREQMSWYENVLRENFTWIIFAINDKVEWMRAKTALISFFMPEWQRKRALRGNKFSDAAIIKIDAENNTDASMAAGDLNADISLRLADTVERFIIRIGKQGIFDSVG